MYLFNIKSAKIKRGTSPRRNLMKKIILLILCVALSLTALVSCGSSDIQDSTTGLAYSVVTNGNVRSLAVYVYDASKLSANVEIPATYGNYTVTEIKAEAFRGLDTIKSVKLSKNINKIGAFAFYDCSMLADISVDEENETYSSKDGSLYSKTGKKLIQYAPGKSDTAFNVPGDVEVINPYAVSGAIRLESVTLNSNVKTIGLGAFENCTKLKSINIPDSVETIDTSAFRECEKLESITLGANVKVIGQHAFLGCTSLATVELGTKLNEIKSYAFDGCKALTVIKLRSTVTTVGTAAFRGCTAINVYVEEATRPNGWSSSWGEGLNDTQIHFSALG